MKLPPVLVYTILRLLAFLVPLGLLLLLPIFRQNWLLAVVFAALIGLSLSLIFLRRPLERVSTEIQTRRRRRAERDEDAEDAAAEAPPADSPSADEGPGEQGGVAERGQ